MSKNDLPKDGNAKANDNNSQLRNRQRVLEDLVLKKGKEKMKRMAGGWAKNREHQD